MYLDPSAASRMIRRQALCFQRRELHNSQAMPCHRFWIGFDLRPKNDSFTKFKRQSLKTLSSRMQTSPQCKANVGAERPAEVAASVLCSQQRNLSAPGRSLREYNRVCVAFRKPMETSYGNLPIFVLASLNNVTTTKKRCPEHQRGERKAA